MMGMDLLWIAVGSVNPAARMPLRIWAGNPNDAKVNGPPKEFTKNVWIRARAANSGHPALGRASPHSVGVRRPPGNKDSQRGRKTFVMCSASGLGAPHRARFWAKSRDLRRGLGRRAGRAA